MENSSEAFQLRMPDDFVEIGLESILFWPPGGHHACYAIAGVLCQAKDVRGFVEHLGFIHVALDKHSFVYFKSANGFPIVAEPKRTVQYRQKLEPGIVKQVLVPEVLVGINDFRGAFEACGETRLSLANAGNTSTKTARGIEVFAFQYSKYGDMCPRAGRADVCLQAVQNGFPSSNSGGLIHVKYFFHFGPPLALLARLQRPLHRHHDGPPFLCSGIGGHFGHVRLIVCPVVFKISE